MQPDDVSVIMVSYNCRQYIEQCLQSIAASPTACSYKVIVVDNNSSDDTVSVVKSNFSNVQLICNEENIGFARGNNQALQIANSRYAMLLNPDTLVREGAFDTIVKFLDAHVHVWALGPAILNGDGSPQRTGIRFPSNWNFLVETLFLDRLFPYSRLFGAHRELYEDYSKPRAVDYVQGSCLVVRKEVIEKVGVLDERFFMYFEETDWCYRIKQAGGAIMFLPSAEVVHFGGGEAGHYNERRLLQYHQSLLKFYRKHYSLKRLFWLKVILSVRSFIRIIVLSLMALGRPKLRQAALSSVKGYAKTFALLTEGA